MLEHTIQGNTLMSFIDISTSYLYTDHFNLVLLCFRSLNILRQRLNILPTLCTCLLNYMCNKYEVVTILFD